jgi:PadR family transcriptional regulator, regulatory protein PadR
MNARKSNPAFLNGVPELLILRLLSRRPTYGYDLVQSIRAATGGSLEFGEGCVYPILHRLESQGVLKSTRENVAGRERVVYRLTAKGKTQLRESVSAWREIVAAIDAALQGGEHGTGALA